MAEVSSDFNRNAECLEVSEMITSFYDAILKYMVEVESDTVRKAAVEAKAGLWFGDTSAGLIDEYLVAKAAHEATLSSALDTK
jgi:hypothetical protein